MSFKASAPGSLMLLGEHAVLSGGYALVCAVDKRITVRVAGRTDDKIIIHSDLHGEYATDLKSLTVENPFQFVLGALKQNTASMRRGCEIEITSTFSDQIGFGSSAAVTVAALAAILMWLNIRISSPELVRRARQVVRFVQGMGSGADVAASVMGGLVSFRAEPFFVEKYAITHPISAWYSGYKTPTPQVINEVQTYFANHPELFRHIQKGIAQCAYDGIQEMRKENWQVLGKIMNIQQGMMDALGVSTPLLQNMVEVLRASPNILGAKISGSGMGDCVVGLGESDKCKKVGKAEVKSIPVAMTLQGVSCEKI